MPSQSDIKDMAELVGNAMEQAVKYDRLTDDRLIEKVRKILSEDMIDFTEALVYFIGMLIVYGKFKNVPHELIKSMFNNSAKLNELSVKIEMMKEFPSLYPQSIYLVKKTFDKKKGQWNTDAVLCMRAAEFGDSDGDRMMATFSLLNKSREDEERQHTGGLAPLALASGEDDL